MTAAPIFVSFASKDRDVAQTICDALENRGFSCWISSRDIGPGENFQVSIVRAIRTAKVMILVFSSNANNSEEIKKELVLAGQSRLAVIPVRVEDVALDDAFAYEFATRQWIDMFDDWERSIQRVVRQLDMVGIIPFVAPEAARSAPSAVAPMRPVETAEPTAVSPAHAAGAPAAEAAQEAPPVTEESAPQAAAIDHRLEPGTAPTRTKSNRGVAIGAAIVVLVITAAAWLWFGSLRARDVPVAVAPAPAPTPAPTPARAPTSVPTPPAASPPEVSVADALREGKAALDRKDYAEATRRFRRAADQGDAVGRRSRRCPGAR